jgi:hypothetical protein
VPEETKTAQVNLRLRPSLKNAAEKAAADDHRSLTSLIEKLLNDHLRKKGYLDPAPQASPRTSSKASAMAEQEIERVADKSATDEERASRKRQLIKGPKEFRDIRRDRKRDT